MEPVTFNRATLLEAFSELGNRAWAEGLTIEIAVYGGSALLLAFDWRVATKDVDAVFEADREAVRRLAASVALDRGWPTDWINDGVKGFLNPRDQEAGIKLLSAALPSNDAPGVRIFIPKPEYLFAMKCRAMRFGGVGENRDIEDLRHLATELGLRTAAEAIDVVQSFYPNVLLQPKVQFGLEEIFAPSDGTISL